MDKGKWQASHLGNENSVTMSVCQTFKLSLCNFAILANSRPPTLDIQAQLQQDAKNGM